MRSRLAAATIDLGAFMFPTLAERDAVIPQNCRSLCRNRDSGAVMKSQNAFQSALDLDLEMNCPDRFRPGAGDPEIIEIGIAELDVESSLEIVREQSCLTRPQREISHRCTRITGLTGDDFKGAKPLKEVIADMRAQWPAKPTGITWGDDGAILTRACRQLHLAMPFRGSST
jgi:hypothetical protein